MATYVPYSHSPRVSDTVFPQMHACIPAPMTPVHSPHHSVTSSISSRTPIHTLSIHEYRRQQNTPSSRPGTPLGKTLRRKAAAPVLSAIQRDSPVTRGALLEPQLSFRPLHPSQSAQQLHLHRSPFQQQLLSDHIIRSQSAEPRTQGGSISSTSTTTSTGKVRYFNSRKRLPKPSIVAASLSFPHFVSAKTKTPHRPPFPTALEFPAAGSRSSDTRTVQTASTFSLSRFPQPPHLIDSSFSPPHDESKRTRIDAYSLVSTAPATPPATPATYHYRGASFDLVNPHDSLLLHDIVTPSRDFGSSEYLPAHTSEELFEDSAEMAPKRALYGDFSAAHAGIMRRPGDSFGSSNLDLPLPPTPTAISPNSSSYTSPIYSPESNFAPHPLAGKKSLNESRFSLKQLTRTLTKRLGKNPEKHGRELQDLRDSNVHVASISLDGDFPRPLDETYVPTPQSAYFPVGPASPFTPTSPMSPQEQKREHPYGQDDYDEVEMPRRYSLQRWDTEPLASLMPDDCSTQMGRVDDPRTSMSEGYLLSRPYYDDLDSIYPSSSVYTADDRRKSNYQQSLTSTGQSNPFLRYSSMDASSFAIESNQENLYGYGVRSHRKSKPLSQDMYGRPAFQEKTDTISKIIDHYDPNTTASNTISTQSQKTTDCQFLPGKGSVTDQQWLPHDHCQGTRIPSGLEQFEFSPHHDANTIQHTQQGDVHNTNQPVLSRRPTMARDVGLPPCTLAPLAPPFQYSEAPFLPYPESSEMFSNRSSYSYGDTRNLLQIPRSDGQAHPVSGQGLQPSSSYSQSDAKLFEPSSSYTQAGSTSPQTPQEALDQADEIFQNAADEQKHMEKGIPAMWAKRSSGSLLLSRKISNQSVENRPSSESPAVDQVGVGEVNETDWESDAVNSHGVRDSLDSIADYSSSEGTRNSLGMNSIGSLPSWAEKNHSQGLSIYSHPSPIRAHPNPFSSSPPQLWPQARFNTTPESYSPPLASSPPGSTTVPVFRLSTHPEDVMGQGAVGKPYGFSHWADQYVFSDKETQELLASGPNDNILFDHERESSDAPDQKAKNQDTGGVMLISSSPVSVFDSVGGLERENTFEKMCVVGPKGNLTGTPQGTGMHETGSSVADFSSPGLSLSSSVARKGSHSAHYPGFYASPYPITSSVTQIQQPQPPAGPEEERTLSQVTLFPRSNELDAVVERSPDDEASQRPSLRCSTNVQRAQRRVSRTAVPGQTKLRQMILAPEAGRKTLSSADTNFSRIMSKGERPSTSDTNTPLRPQLSVETFPTVRTLMAHQHSPHLLCPERAANPEDEERRRKLSWAILAVFCLLPPCIVLYRVWGDTIMVSLTKGHLGHCTNKSKRVALIAGIAVNVGIAIAIVVPIVVAHALGAA